MCIHVIPILIDTLIAIFLVVYVLGRINRREKELALYINRLHELTSRMVDLVGAIGDRTEAQLKELIPSLTKAMVGTFKQLTNEQRTNAR